MREAVKRQPVTAGRALVIGPALLLGLAAALWLQPLIHSGALTTPDSLQYLHAARSLRAGHGLTTVDGSLWSDAVYRPLTTWPPLYPVVLSLAVAGLERPEVGAGRLATVLFALTVALFFLAARRLCRLPIAAAATLFFAVNTTVLTVFAYAWSEHLFLSLMLAAWLALEAALQPSPQRGWRAWWPLLAAGAAVAAATYTRYIGLALFLVLLAPLAPARSNAHGGDRGRAPVRRVMAALLLAALFVAPLLIRNRVMSGHWGGAAQPPPTRSLPENLADLAAALRCQLIGPDAPAWVLGLAVLALAAGAACWWRGQRGRAAGTPADQDCPTDHPHRADGAAVRWLPWVFALVYFGALVGLRSAASFDRIDARLSAPGMMFVVLGIAAVGEVAVMAASPRAGRRVTMAVAVLLLGLAAGQVAGDLRLIRAIRGGEAEPFRMTATAHYVNFARIRVENLPTAVRREAERCRQADAILVSDANPLLLHHLLAVKAKALPDTLEDPAVLARINTMARDGSLVILDARKAARLRAVAGEGWDDVASTQREGQGSVTVVRLPVP